MREFTARTAFVTGAGNGIGLGIARALARAGANVAIADIDGDALEVAKGQVEEFGTKVMTVPLDVSDRAAVERAADEVESHFGEVHVLVNNAGVSIGAAPVTDIDATQWDWIFGVNLFGVVNGVHAFVPRMVAHGAVGHVVNTASIGGMQVHPELRNGSYAMTKYGVVALSEALDLQLETSAIGVSVFCPALVRTTLGQSSQRRPARFGGPYEAAPTGSGVAGMAAPPVALEPDQAGARVLAAIENEDFFIFTHPETRGWLDERHARITKGFDALDAFVAGSERT